MACPEMKNISITQKNPDGTSIPLTFKGCIVSRNNGKSSNSTKGGKYTRKRQMRKMKKL